MNFSLISIFMISLVTRLSKKLTSKELRVGNNKFVNGGNNDRLIKHCISPKILHVHLYQQFCLCSINVVAIT